MMGLTAEFWLRSAPYDVPGAGACLPRCGDGFSPNGPSWRSMILLDCRSPLQNRLNMSASRYCQESLASPQRRPSMSYAKGKQLTVINPKPRMNP